MAAEGNKRTQRWCFTMNNPNSNDALDIENLKKECKYMVVGNEKGEAGTHHFQGYVQFKTWKSLKAVKKLARRAHLEPAKGTWEQNYEYCTKEGDWIQYGTKPASQVEKGQKGADASKERWKRMRMLAREDNYEAMEEEFPRELTLYEQAFMKLTLHERPLLDLESGTVIGTWIYGPAGTGKTYWATHNIVPREQVYMKDLSKWWDGYDSKRHTLVVIDDMDPFHKSMARDFKIWVQEYEFMAQQKGSYIKIRPEAIVVTSNYKIEEIWDDETTRNTLNRRFIVKSKFSKDKEPEIVKD